MVRSGETGLIVPADEPEAMAAAVAGLLEEPEHALAMAERARQEVARYTWSEIRTAWAAAYSGGTTAGRAA
jgi:glycosyltransferase involved in cell wall biosynthesis